jgi:hypothetical protein
VTALFVADAVIDATVNVNTFPFALIVPAVGVPAFPSIDTENLERPFAKSSA